MAAAWSSEFAGRLEIRPLLRPRQARSG